MSILDLIKRLPVDLGQGYYRHTTKAKVTAFSTIGDGHGKKALDLGCGDGYWTKQLEKKGWEVTPVDGFDFRHPRAKRVDAEKTLPFENNTFDLIWCSEVIEHVKNVEQFVSEMRRVLKPGGRIVTTTPNSAFWLYNFLKVLGFTPKQVQNPDHKQFFNLADIKRLFPKAKIRGFFPYAVIKITIDKAVGPLSPTFIITETVEKA